MTIQQIFQIISPTGEIYQSLMKNIYPQYNETTNWNDIQERERIGIALQYSILTGKTVNSVIEEINKLVDGKK